MRHCGICSDGWPKEMTMTDRREHWQRNSPGREARQTRKGKIAACSRKSKAIHNVACTSDLIAQTRWMDGFAQCAVTKPQLQIVWMGAPVYYTCRAVPPYPGKASIDLGKASFPGYRVSMFVEITLKLPGTRVSCYNANHLPESLRPRFAATRKFLRSPLGADSLVPGYPGTSSTHTDLSQAASNRTHTITTVENTSSSRTTGHGAKLQIVSRYPGTCTSARRPTGGGTRVPGFPRVSYLRVSDYW
eukprot:2306104-Rhodomonas_salina.1